MSNGREPASGGSAAHDAPLRRPRGAERRSLQVGAAPRERATTVGPAQIGRRFKAGLRYTGVETAQLDELAAQAEASAPAAAAPVVDLHERRLARPQRRTRIAASHKFAAAAAVSGLALTAAWPQLNDPGTEARAKAEAQATVEDVVVPAADDFDIELASVQGAVSEENALDQVMTAAAGDITKVETAGVLAQPLDTVRITSRFGYRANPWGGAGMVNHIGQDYGIACGTPVKAAAAGTVVQAEYAGHSGNRVRVDHGNGLETTYNHNTSLKVAVGDKIERGDVVSLSGTTGNSTGCHLHFEVLVDGTAVDPAGWL
ncbi:M23 family metallopeptidase [Zhihengliuella halotolerans]|uniref:M23 family metallopeptidase n=1 Tax=Zhihengliuella halotolerans TaxID=370736 RepID=UPI002155B9A3|nr:M23 family metallopeptidase [Zhihengliuella halotolerans]